MSDVGAVHEGDRIATLDAIGAQAAELHGEPDPLVTCPCGTVTTLAGSFRCYYCWVRFCEPCAEEHFEEGEGE